MQGLTEDGRRIVESVANRHGFSIDATSQLLTALAAGGGWQAQFSHPELGGMGQWSSGGMIMIGDMFNNGLKYRVDALCNDLATVLRDSSPLAPVPMQSQNQNNGQYQGHYQGSGQNNGQSQSQSNGMNGGGMNGNNTSSGMTSLFVPGSSGNRWPAELGNPSSAGSQNDLHYAVFPHVRRLAIERGGQVSVYDTGNHVIGGFSQQQGGDQSLTFTSQFGLIRVTDLPIVTNATPADNGDGSGNGSGTDYGTANFAPAPQQVAAPIQAPMQTPMPPPIQTAPEPAPFAPQPPFAPVQQQLAPATSDDEIFSRIERLADLRKKDIITAQEFEAKKAELLARL